MTNAPESQSDDNADQWVVRAAFDREALGLLYDRLYPSVFRYCIRRSGNRGLAEDIAATVFLNVAAKIATFSGKTLVEFRRWVFTIATNEINANYRKASRRETLLLAAAQSGQLHRSAMGISDPAGDGHDELQAAILRLNDKEQAILTMRFFSDLPYEEIAQIAGVSPGTARTAASRALGKIRQDLGRE